MKDDFFNLFDTTENGSLIPDRLRLGILHLNEARHFADRFGFEHWQFAVDLKTLIRLGMTTNDCRWMFCTNVVDHGIETTMEGEETRSFRSSDVPAFTGRSCFVLTDEGSSFASSLARRSVSLREYAHDDFTVPSWRDDQQELYLGDLLIKRFKLPAGNQTAVLRAFQEEEWASRIDDPLPPKDGRDSKRRLHDTINSLNRNQKHPLVRFYGDGTGKGVCWKLI